jgi:hypothetical protein
MNEFFAALRHDLLDRRLRAVLILLTAGLVGAVAYAALGGGSSTPAATAPAIAPLTGASGSITPVAAGSNPSHALAELPGSSKQRRGATRNPFNPLPGSFSAAATTTKGGTSPSTKTSTKTESTPSAGGTAPKSPRATSPATPKATYDVTLLMGPVPPGTPPQGAQLTLYEHVRFQQKLPSPQLRLLAFDGVSSDGKKATFKLIGEVIPRGGLATCLPSPTQCQTIELETNQTEELEYLPPTGSAVVYQLQVEAITGGEAKKH